MSESSPSIQQETAPRRANFTPLPPSRPTSESIDATVSTAIKQTESEMAAKAKVTHEPTLPMKATQPEREMVASQLPPGVTQGDIDRLQGNITNKKMTAEQAQAELEQLVTKSIGTPPEEHKPPPIKKSAVTEKTIATPPKVSEAPPTSSEESKFPALQKIKNMFGKVWDSITSFLRGITSWITK